MDEIETARMAIRDRQIRTAAARRVIGDTPQHGKHLVYDSAKGVHAECDGGLAFALGVACLEAELVKEPSRFWQVCHPNCVIIYHVMWQEPGQIIVVNVGSDPHAR